MMTMHTSSPAPIVAPDPAIVTAIQADPVATLAHVALLLRTGKYNNDQIWDALDGVDAAAIEPMLDELDAIDNEEYDPVVHSPLTKKQFTSKQGVRKGVLFEQFSKEIMEGNKCFSVDRDVATVSNQIDLLVKMSWFSALVPIFSEWGPNFICECKYHNKRFDGDWIDQLVSLLVAQHANVGILITKHSASFKGSASSVATKLQLFAVQNKVILLFSRDELRKCAQEGRTLREIIKRYIDVKNGIPVVLQE